VTSVKLERKPEKRGRLILDPKTLNMAGLDHVEVSKEISASDTARLIEGIQSEECVHSWKNVKLSPTNSILNELIQSENNKRPTEFFFYIATRNNGDQTLLAVGTVAHKISSSFAHDGYPVIARCYIMPEFRNYRLYMPILKHRFEFCHKFFGDRLRGIHLGSQNPRIHSVVKKNLFELPFAYIGDEYLSQKDSFERVYDYLWFSPQLRSELLSLSEQKTDNLVLRGLNRCVRDMIENKFDSTSFHRLLTFVEKAQQTDAAVLLESSRALREVIDFMHAVPLINESVKTEPVLVPTAPRTGKAA